MIYAYCTDDGPDILHLSSMGMSYAKQLRHIHIPGYNIWNASKSTNRKQRQFFG